MIFILSPLNDSPKTINAHNLSDQNTDIYIFSNKNIAITDKPYIHLGEQLTAHDLLSTFSFKKNAILLKWQNETRPPSFNTDTSKRVLFLDNAVWLSNRAAFYFKKNMVTFKDIDTLKKLLQDSNEGL